MLRFYKVSLYMYLGMSLFAFYLAYTARNDEGNTKYVLLGMAFMALGMFFFRRSFIKKLEKRNEL